MKSLFLTIALSFSALLTTQGAELQSIRDWTNTEGKVIKATLVSHDPQKGTVELKLPTGKTVSIKSDTLSGKDKEWLSSLPAQKGKKGDPATLTEGKIGKATTIPGTDDYPECLVYYPSKLDIKKAPPLLILFDPCGNGAGLAHTLQKACDETGWAVLGCNQFKNNEGELEKEFSKFWENLLTRLDELVFYDPDRMYLGGMSGGSVRAYTYSSRTGDLARPWKGIIAMGGWLGKTATKLNCPTRMTVAMVNGDKDENARSYENRDSKILKRRQCKIKKFPFDGGHQVAPADHFAQILKWMDEECASTREQQMPVELKGN